jgi:tetratricopeptide (TPR) repeat protein
MKLPGEAVDLVIPVPADADRATCPAQWIPCAGCCSFLLYISAILPGHQLFYMRLVIILIIFIIVHSQCTINRSIVGGSDFEDLSARLRAEYEYSLSEGIKYRLLEDYQRAVYFLQRCLEIYSESDVAYFELSNIFYAADDLPRSIQFAERAKQIDPGNKWYHYQLGMLLREGGKIDEAIEVYRNGVRQFPWETEMRFTLAALLAQSERFAEALSVYKELEDMIGFNERISLAREHIYVKTANYELAHNEITRLIEEFPGDPRFFGILAELYASIGMFDEALESYNKLFELDPENGMAQLSVAEFFLRSGKETESLYYLKKAFDNPSVGLSDKIGFFSVIVENKLFSPKFDQDIADLGETLLVNYPENDLVKMILSELYLNYENFERASDLLFELYLSDSLNVIIAEQLIRVKYFGEDYSVVVALGEKMIPDFPGSLIILYFSGVSNHLTGNSGRAIEILVKALEVKDADRLMVSHIYAYIGEIYNDKKYFDESDKYFKASLEIDSTNIITLNNYAYYLALREENLETALRYSHTTLLNEPDNASFLDTYAWILYKLGQYAEAEKYIEKAFINGGESSFEVVKHYAAILISLGKYSEASAYIEQARKLAEAGELQQLDIYIEKIRDASGRNY